MDNMAYPAIIPKLLRGEMCISHTSLTLNDYWQWAHSNLVDNAERGALAEYLVHSAVGASNPTRVNWDKYDVMTPEGVAVEVKASGYIQSWAQDRLSAINFSIRPTYGWDSRTNTYSDECVRQSDVYVFCLLAHKEQETIDPLDTDQWRFYVLPTRVLNEKVPEQKTITLSGIIRLGAEETDFSGLRDAVLTAAKSD